MNAREEILARIRGATADVDTPPGSRDPLAEPDDPPERARTLELFAEIVADYRAEVVPTTPGEAGAAITAALSRHGCRSVVVPGGLPEDWVAAATSAGRIRVDDGRLTASELDGIDAVVTGAALGIAATGTVVLDHRADQGRRAITLVPDTHVCVVRTDQVVHDVPEAVRRLRPPPGQARPLTWISGPSATSDIELERVEGVHGPRTLVVVLVGEAS